MIGNAAVMLLVVTLGVVVALTGRRSFEQRAQDAADNLATSLSQAIESELERVDTLLRAIALEHARVGADGASLRALLDRQHMLIDELDSLGATDNEGVVRHGSGSDATHRVTLADRDYFVQARTHPGPALFVDGPLQSRISRKWVIVLARRLERGDGRFDGVVFANVAAERFEQMFSGVNLGRDGAISLRMRPSLQLVARHTQRGAASTAIGSSRVSAELERALRLQPRAGSFLATTVIDQVERANAYRSLESFPLTVIAGLGTAEFLAPWRAEVAVVAGLCLLTGALLSICTWLVLLARRSEIASRLALQASESFLDRTGRIAAVGGWELDIASGVLRWSDQTCRLFDAPAGYRPSLEESLALVAPEARVQVREHLDRSIATGASWMLELPAHSRTGRALWVRAVAEVEFDQGRPARVVGAVQDITEQRERKAELEREQALRAQLEAHAHELDAMVSERGEMLDVLAHEVRQPLNNASAALQSAATELAEMDKPAASLRLSRAQSVMSQVLGRLDNTLAVASLLARPDPIERGDADVDALVAVAIADMPAEQRARVQIERATSTRTASMDMSLMRLALRNLLSNALKHGPPQTPVRVRLSDWDHPLALVIEVSDAGPGVPEEVVPRLFERGARGAPGGHGLGLYIVRRVMELHEGRVELASNAPGRVTMRLVVVQAPTE